MGSILVNKLRLLGKGRWIGWLTLEVVWMLQIVYCE